MSDAPLPPHGASPALQQLATALGLEPGTPELTEALTHKSYANERRGTPDNQRLEFLGDAVLGLCVADLLHRRFPELDEGGLTRLRARLVNAEALAGFARELCVASALRLGRGAEADGLTESTSVLSDALEALLGAVYRCRGLGAARDVVERLVDPELARLASGAEGDPKSTLQELCQARHAEAPTYRVVAEGGPAHERWFEAEVRLGERVLAVARGRSKRLAERGAAELALQRPEFSEAAVGPRRPEARGAAGERDRKAPDE